MAVSVTETIWQIVSGEGGPRERITLKTMPLRSIYFTEAQSPLKLAAGDQSGTMPGRDI